MQKFYMLFLSMVFSLGLCAQEPGYMGKAVDHLGRPLSGVKVSLVGNSDVAITDVNGNFFFSKVKNSVAELRASLPGYQTLNQKIGVYPSSTTLVIILKPLINQLQEVHEHRNYKTRFPAKRSGGKFDEVIRALTWN
jgi:hypothetical protein